MGHAECVELLHQHAAAAAAAGARSAVPHRVIQGDVAARPRDAAAARDTEYPVCSDEMELHRHAADVVATTLSNACTALQLTDNIHTNHHRHDDEDVMDEEKATPTKVIISAS